jgi:hypothetical protein
MSTGDTPKGVTDSAIGRLGWAVIVLVPIASLVIAIWSSIPLPSAFQGWTNGNLALQGVGLGVVLHRGLRAQAEARAKGQLAEAVSPLRWIGVAGILCWSVAGLVLLLSGGVLKPIHTFIALELGTIMPILSYAVAKAAGWNGQIQGFGRKVNEGRRSQTRGDTHR